MDQIRFLLSFYDPRHPMRGVLIALRYRGLFVFITASASFLIYLRTLAPSVLPGDSAEFQFAAWGWTLAHPTGYPLYLILGGLWQHLVPWGDPAFRLNLFSAVCAAITVGLSYRVFYRVAKNRGAALIATLTLAVSYTFWSQATEAEVYALNTFFVALLLWLALKWEEEREFKYGAAWAFAFGLALAHHRTIVLLVPAFAAFFADAIFVRARQMRAYARRGKQITPAVLPPRPTVRRDAAYAILFALPLLLYLYIPLRAPATPYTQLRISPAQTITAFENTPSGWLNSIFGRTFQSELSFDNTSLAALMALPQHLADEFNPIGVAFGALGLLLLFYERRAPLAALTLFGFVTTVLFAVSYHIGDIRDFYTPAYFFFAVAIAAALGAIFRYLTEHARFRASLIPATALLLITALVPLNNFFASFNDEDRSFHTQARDRWLVILSSNLPRNAILVSNDRDEITPMWYLQYVEHKRPDVLGLFPLVSPDPAYANVVRLVDSVIDSGRPVFIIKHLPGLALRFRLDPSPADLLRVAEASPPPPSFKSNAVVGGKLRVAGYSIISGVARANATLVVAVYWQPLAPLGRDYSTALQIFDASGRKLAQGNDHQPGGDVYPMSRWQRGELLDDQFTITLPPNTPAGIYHLFVRVYTTEGDDTLGDLTEIGTLQVTNQP